MGDDIHTLKLNFAADAEALRTEFDAKMKILVENYEARLAAAERVERTPKLAGIKALLARSSESSLELTPIRDPPLLQSPPTKEPHAKRYVCSYANCQYRTSDSSDIGRHINDRHDTTRIYVCPICGDCYKQTTNVKTHSDSKHSATLVFRNPSRQYKLQKDGREVTVRIGEIHLTTNQKALWGERKIEELEVGFLLDRAARYRPSYR